MLEGRDEAEWVAVQMGLLFVRTDPGLDELVGNPLFFERQARAADVGTAGKAVNDRARHGFTSIAWTLHPMSLPDCSDRHFFAIPLVRVAAGHAMEVSRTPIADVLGPSP
jgi:hypothetical protein